MTIRPNCDNVEGEGRGVNNGFRDRTIVKYSH